MQADLGAPSRALPADNAAFEGEVRLERLRRRRRSYPLRRLIEANLRDLLRLLQEAWLPLLGFALVLFTGALYLVLFYNDPEVCRDFMGPCHRIVPALYQTARLMLLDPDIPFPNDLLGELLFFLIPILGLSLIFQSVLDFGRLLLDKGSRREAWQVSLAGTFKNHFIVCGLGRVSYRVVLQLLEIGQDVVVIERDWNSEFVSTVIGLKVPVILGDSREPAILEQAGLSRARGLLTGINDDLLNVEIALAARRRRPDLQIVMRIFNQELDTTLEQSFGRNSAFSSSNIAAPTMAAAALSRGVIRVLSLRDGLLGVAQLEVARNSELTGFVHAFEETYDVRVLRIYTKEGQERRTGYMETINGGETITVIGELEAIDQLHLHNQAGSKYDFLSTRRRQILSEHHDTVIVCGLGKVGYRLVKTLLQAPECPAITVICNSDTRGSFLEELRRHGVRIVIGDAREADVLRDAGIERAYSIAAVISNDLSNLQIGMLARQLRSDIHLVLRMFSDVLAERLATLFGINTTYSASDLAAATLAAATILRDVDGGLDIGDRLFAAVTVTVYDGDEFCGRQVGHLRDHNGLMALAVYRHGERLRPLKDETVLHVDDEVMFLFDSARIPPPRPGIIRPADYGLRRLAAAAPAHARRAR
jgi:Trk K+ transport system NAD-binding subunit